MTAQAAAGYAAGPPPVQSGAAVASYSSTSVSGARTPIETWTPSHGSHPRAGVHPQVGSQVEDVVLIERLGVGLPQVGTECRVMFVPLHDGVRMVVVYLQCEIGNLSHLGG